MQETQRCGFDPWVGKIPWSRKWHPTPVFLPGKFHWQRSLVGYCPWGYKELDRTEQLSPSVLIFRATAEMMIGWEDRRSMGRILVKMLQSLSLPVFCWESFLCLLLFFPSKVSSGCCKPLVNFQSLEEVNFDNFLPVFLLLLWRNRFFGSPYSLILELL